MVLAPTYPMLRDATLRTFLDLARRGNALAEFNKSEMRVVLVNGTTALFRSADDPDRLRGPNLGWFWCDEAAMMPKDVWLIMLGRLRESPGRAWLTTTPRGKDWIYKDFKGERKAGYHLAKADSRTNVYLPDGFVADLLDTYEHDFARQEVGGEFLDDTFGRLVPDWWIERCEETERPAHTRQLSLGVDLGEGTGRNHTVLCLVDEHGIVSLEGSANVGIPEAALKIKQLRDRHDLKDDRIAFDAGGRGKDLPKYLEQYRIEARPYHGGGKGGARWANRRSRMAWKLRQRLDPERPKVIDHGEKARSPWDADKPGHTSIQPPFSLPGNRPWWPRLKEEIAALKYEVEGGKVKLERKEDMTERLGRSPDYVDSLLIALSVGEVV